MADYQQTNVLTLPDPQTANQTSDNNQLVEQAAMSVAKSDGLRATLATAYPRIYTTARLNQMTYNDLVHAYYREFFPYKTGGPNPSWKNSAFTKTWLDVRDYDPEQHYFPNGAVSEVMGGLPGSSHPIVFGEDNQGTYIYEDVSVGHDLSTTLPVELHSLTQYRLEVKIRPQSWDNGIQRVVTILSTTFVFQMSAGGIFTLSANSNSASSAAHGLVDGDAAWIAVAVDGADADFFTSTDGQTWTQVGSTVTAAGNLTLPSSGALRFNAHSTVSGWAGHGYEIRFRTSNAIASDLGLSFNAAQFTQGNRGHLSTSTDAQGNTWTLERAGAPISLIDPGDGNGKRVRLSGTTGNGLTSNQKPNLSAKDLFVWAWMEQGTVGATEHIVGQWGAAGDKAVQLRKGSGGEPRFTYTTDGSTEQSASLSATPSWWGTGYGWVGAHYQHSNGFVYWYDGGQGITPSWSLVESDSIGVQTFHDESDVIPVTVGINNNDANPFTGDILETGIGSSTSSMYDYSHFDANLVDRYGWRLDNCTEASSRDGEAWTVLRTDSAEDSNDPVVLWHTGTNYAWFDGSGSSRINHTSTQAMAAGSVCSVRADIQLDGYATGSAQRCLDGSLILAVTGSGALNYQWNSTVSFRSEDSSATLPVADGQRIQIRADHDNTNDTVDFYYRLDYSVDLANDTGWTALGTQQAANNEDFNASLTGGVFAQRYNSASSGFDIAGKLFRGSIIDDGSVISNMNPTDSNGDGTSWTDSLIGGSVSIDRATTGFCTTIVTRPVVVFGGSHYIEIPHHPDISTLPVTWGLGGRLHDYASSWLRLVSAEIGGSEGITLQTNNSDPRVYFRGEEIGGSPTWDAGNNADNITHSTKFSIVGTAVSGDQETYIDGVSVDTDNKTITDVDGGANTRIGLRADSIANEIECFELFEFVALNKRVSATEAADLNTELVA